MPRFLAIVTFALLFLLSPNATHAKQPNILFIFADDQCFDTLRAWGNDEIETPNLDRLARRGLTFRRAYNMGSWSGAVCVASRTMLNTGRFLWQAHEVHPTTEQEREAGRFWSEYLKAAGYDTYFSGKWHVKADPERAFDYASHVRPGMPNQTPAGYNRPIEGQPDQWSPYDRQFEGFWKGGKHWSEVLSDDAVGYLRQATERDKPFFMYLAFNAAHDPRRIRRLPDRAWRAMEHRSVASTTACEVMAFDHTGKTLALAHAADVDELGGGEHRNLDRFSHLDVFVGLEPELA